MKLQFAIARFFIRTIGQTSQGVRMCFRYGLTSGKTLDYVYRNEPSGIWPVGKLFDRIFLRDPGWEAVRTRRRNLEQLMTEAIDSLTDRQQTVSVLDVASGPASYVLSVIAQRGNGNIFARCRDFDERWVKDGRQEAQRQGLSNVVFEQGDAFDRETILSLRPKPNLAISSGFYDWINDDGKVRDSIRILFDALEPGGYFVMSNQVAHPKLEFTQAVFVDFNNKPLQMTMRPQETIDRWLSEAGFQVESTLQDDKGYYSVTKSRKP